MKKHLFLLIILSLSLQFSFAQLTLIRSDSSKKVVIKNTSFITLKFPSISRIAKDTNENFYSIRGRLVASKNDSVKLIVSNIQRVFTDVDSVYKKAGVIHGIKNSKPSAPIKLINLEYLAVENKGIKSLKAIGGGLIVFSLLQGLVLNPFLTDKLKGSSTKVMWASFGTGLTLALLPDEKKYYFKQPMKGKKKTIWKIAPQ